MSSWATYTQSMWPRLNSGRLQPWDTSRVLALADPDLDKFAWLAVGEVNESRLEALQARFTKLFERFSRTQAVDMPG